MLGAKALRAVIRQYQRRGTEVRVLHVIQPVSAYLSADLMPHFAEHIGTIEQDRKRQAQKIVAHAAEKLRTAGFKSSALVVPGEPAAENYRAGQALAGRRDRDRFVRSARTESAAGGKRVGERGAARGLFSGDCAIVGRRLRATRRGKPLLASTAFRNRSLRCSLGFCRRSTFRHTLGP